MFSRLEIVFLIISQYGYVVDLEKEEIFDKNELKNEVCTIKTDRVIIRNSLGISSASLPNLQVLSSLANKTSSYFSPYFFYIK